MGQHSKSKRKNTGGKVSGKAKHQAVNTTADEAVQAETSQVEGSELENTQDDVHADDQGSTSAPMQLTPEHEVDADQAPQAEVGEEALESEPAVTDVQSGSADDTLSDLIDQDEVKTETVSEDIHAQDVPAVAPQAARETSTFVPLALGGVIAAALGYAAATFWGLDGQAKTVELEAQLQAQDQQIQALEQKLAGFVSVKKFDELQAGVAQALTVSERFDAMDQRLIVVEKQPSADGTLQESAIAAFQRDIDELRQQTLDLSSEAAAALAVTKTQAEEMAARAKLATARDIVLTVKDQAAQGQGFNANLERLAAVLGQPLPEALSTFGADGVLTLSQLQQDFPVAAREALQIARKEGVSGEVDDGIGAFFRKQLNVRSVAPQDGDSVDAVLSRAGAAVTAGALSDALDLVQGLPEVAQVPFETWVSQATAKVSVGAALDDLSQSLTQQ